MGVTPAVRARSLVKRYGEKTAVGGLDLEIQPGQCLGLLGPNGAGKTTTVEMLEGLHAPDSGSIELFGIAWGTGRDHELRQKLGVQLQDTQLADKLKVEEVLRLFRSFCQRGHSIDRLLELVDLKAERLQLYYQLSGGQKQRVALACALAGDPELLFLDEPTTGLDPRARQNLWKVVERFRSGGGTVLITTHYMEEAAYLCDRIAIVDHGKLIAEETPTALVDSLGEVQFVEFECQQTLDRTALQLSPVVLQVQQRGAVWRLRIERTLAALREVLAELERQQVVPIGLATHQASLDDVFMSLTGRKLTGSDKTETPGSEAA